MIPILRGGGGGGGGGGGAAGAGAGEASASTLLPATASSTVGAFLAARSAASCFRAACLRASAWRVTTRAARFLAAFRASMRRAAAWITVAAPACSACVAPCAMARVAHAGADSGTLSTTIACRPAIAAGTNCAARSPFSKLALAGLTGADTLTAAPLRATLVCPAVTRLSAHTAAPPM